MKLQADGDLLDIEYTVLERVSPRAANASVARIDVARRHLALHDEARHGRVALHPPGEYQPRVRLVQCTGVRERRMMEVLEQLGSSRVGDSVRVCAFGCERWVDGDLSTVGAR